ncbi:MAG TPA: hypothetical protein VLV48_06075 [Thermoanaerobaculia bacterium]|nr:hypothetical protein [Thermoanaerobaculia bacterium]
MACWTIKITPEVIQKRETALERMEKALQAGTVTVKIGATGAIAFSKPMSLTDDGFSDVCAYRALLSRNSPGLRKAVARAEAMAGRKVNPQAINSGMHSHDGGKTWGSH